MRAKKEAPENLTQDTDMPFRHGSIMQVMVSLSLFFTSLDFFQVVELHVRRQSELWFSPTIELRRRTQRKWKIDASVRYLFMSQWGCQETRSRFQSGSLYQPC